MAACFVAAGTAGLPCCLQNEGGPSSVSLLAEKMSFASCSLADLLQFCDGLLLPLDGPKHQLLEAAAP